jgi:hypothetical protein
MMNNNNIILSAEKTVQRFISILEESITSDIILLFNDSSKIKNIKFSILMSTTTHFTSKEYKNLVDCILKECKGEFNQKIVNLIEYMNGHRDQCSRYPEIDLATLKIASKYIQKA